MMFKLEKCSIRRINPISVIKVYSSLALYSTKQEFVLMECDHYIKDVHICPIIFIILGIYPMLSIMESNGLYGFKTRVLMFDCITRNAFIAQRSAHSLIWPLKLGTQLTLSLIYSLVKNFPTLNSLINLINIVDILILASF